MKKNLLILSLFLLSGCMNHHNIYGTYQATLPAADAPGIDVTLKLNRDKTFNNKLVFQERENGTFYENGTYTLKGNILKLKDNEKITYFEIGKEKLWMLDYNKQRISGPLSKFYIFSKQKD